MTETETTIDPFTYALRELRYDGHGVAAKIAQHVVDGVIHNADVNRAMPSGFCDTPESAADLAMDVYLDPMPDGLGTDDIDETELEESELTDELEVAREAVADWFERFYLEDSYDVRGLVKRMRERIYQHCEIDGVPRPPMDRLNDALALAITGGRHKYSALIALADRPDAPLIPLSEATPEIESTLSQQIGYDVHRYPINGLVTLVMETVLAPAD